MLNNCHYRLKLYLINKKACALSGKERFFCIKRKGIAQNVHLKLLHLVFLIPNADDEPP